MIAVGRKRAALVTLLIIVLLLLSACSGSSGSPAVEATNRAATQMADSDEHMDADSAMDDSNPMDGDEDADMDEHSDTDEHADTDGQADMDEHSEMGEPADGMMDMEHEHLEPPAEYEGLTNPYTGDQDAISEGATIFATTCATCHGATGMGDGPAALGLDPKPATLADQDMLMSMSDSYLFWRVNEGGAMEPFNSAMPAWKDVYSQDQLWKVIAFIRTLGG